MSTLYEYGFNKQAANMERLTEVFKKLSARFLKPGKGMPQEALGFSMFNRPILFKPTSNYRPIIQSLATKPVNSRSIKNAVEYKTKLYGYGEGLEPWDAVKRFDDYWGSVSHLYAGKAAQQNTSILAHLHEAAEGRAAGKLLSGKVKSTLKQFDDATALQGALSSVGASPMVKKDLTAYIPKGVAESDLRRVLGSTGKIKPTFFSHQGPGIMLKEHNMLATLPANEQHVGDGLRAMRGLLEGELFKSVGLEFGKGSRLSPRMVTHYADKLRAEYLKRGLNNVSYM